MRLEEVFRTIATSSEGMGWPENRENVLYRGSALCICVCVDN